MTRVLVVFRKTQEGADYGHIYEWNVKISVLVFGSTTVVIQYRRASLLDKEQRRSKTVEVRKDPETDVVKVEMAQPV